MMNVSSLSKTDIEDVILSRYAVPCRRILNLKDSSTSLRMTIGIRFFDFANAPLRMTGDGSVRGI